MTVGIQDDVDWRYAI